jgi:hypothetical protein
MPRELSPSSVLHQAEAFLDFAAKLGDPWRSHWPRWSTSKDFEPTDSRAIFRAVQAAVGASERAA